MSKAVEKTQTYHEMSLNGLPLAPGRGVPDEAGHVDVRLRCRETAALGRLYEGLLTAKAKLPEGQVVSSRPQAVRWLLAKMADEIDKQAAL